MTEKKFTIPNMGLDGRLIKEDGKIMEIDRVINLLNENEQLKQKIKELEQENQGLQFKIIDMLDFIKEKGTVTREEIKEWWNGDVE